MTERCQERGKWENMEMEERAREREIEKEDRRKCDRE